MIDLLRHIPAHKKHVIFDWNGTLLDDVDYCVKVINGVLTQYGKSQIERDDYRRLFRFPVLHYYEAIGFDFSSHDFVKVSDAFIAGYSAGVDECRLFAGSRELVEGLSAGGLTCHILTATQQSYIEGLLQKMELRSLFDLVYGLDNSHAHGKTERGVELLRAIGAPATDLILIGDTNHDFEVAKALGIDALILADGHQEFARLQDLDCVVLESRY